MRISDWSSDVCASDLETGLDRGASHNGATTPVATEQYTRRRALQHCRQHQPMESVGQRGELAVDGAPLALDARALLGIQHREGLGRPARPRVRCNEADPRPATGGKEPVPGWPSLCECDVKINRAILAATAARKSIGEGK